MTYVFGAELVGRKVNSAIRATADLLNNGVLINPVIGSAIILVACILHTSIQSFLSGQLGINGGALSAPSTYLDLAVGARLPFVLPERTLEGLQPGGIGSGRGERSAMPSIYFPGYLRICRQLWSFERRRGRQVWSRVIPQRRLRLISESTNDGQRSRICDRLLVHLAGMSSQQSRLVYSGDMCAARGEGGQAGRKGALLQGPAMRNGWCITRFSRDRFRLSVVRG